MPCHCPECEEERELLDVMEDPDTGIHPLPASEDPDEAYDRMREERFTGETA